MTQTTITRFINALLRLLPSYKGTYRSRFLPPYLHETVVGLLLADGSIERSTPTSNARLSICFGEVNLLYLLHLYNLLEPYIDSVFNFNDVYNSRTGKWYVTVSFKTVSLPVFAYYHHLFYKARANGKGYIKIVPSDIIDHITPVSLAHLIMGDGNYNQGAIRIFTNSFTKSEVELLTKAITNKLDIETSFRHDRNDQ